MSAVPVKNAGKSKESNFESCNPVILSGKKGKV